MQWNVITGNIIAFIASVAMLIAGVRKTKKGTVQIQLAQSSLFVTADLFLMAITGAIGDFLSFFIFLFTYKKKMNAYIKIVIILIMFASSIFLNTLGYLDFFPAVLISTYALISTSENVFAYKLVYGITALFWAYYEFNIQAYTSCCFSIIYFFTNIITMLRIAHDRKNVDKKGGH